MTTKDSASFGRAVIIGGSVAGTLAAAAIAHHFDQVLVIDGDTIPDEPVFRKGVPHGAHFHALLAAGRQAMDQLVPGFSKHAQDLGAETIDSAEDVMRLDRFGWSPRFESKLEFLMASRPLIEKALRDLVSTMPQVEYRFPVRIASLTGVDGRVTGVINTDGEEIQADLVIDASGRLSATPKWLEELGYPCPVESVVNAHWGYASTFVRVPDGWDPGFQALAVTPFGAGAQTPETERRAIAMWVNEGDRRWILTVQGAAGDYPPSDETQLREFASKMGVPEIDKALSEIEFGEQISVWRDTRNRLRDYPAQTERPENFFVIGDAWMGFNPVYGQGMTAAALEAVHLRDELEAQVGEHPGSLSGLAARFYAAADPLIQYCWTSSNSADQRIPGVEFTVDGVPVPVEASSTDFTDRLGAYMTLNEERYVKYRETTQLLRTPEWLQEADIVDAVHEKWDELGAMIVAR